MPVYLPLDKEKLERDVLKALRAWYATDGTEEDQLAQLTLVRARRKALGVDKPPLTRLATNEILLEGLEALEKQGAKEAALILRLRFLDKETVGEVTSQLRLINNSLISDNQTKHYQRQAVQSLAHILFQKERSFRQASIHSIEAQLPPPPYSHDGLFGVEEAFTTLTSHLLTTSRPWVLAITGIGGIGKTSLADAAVRHIIHFFQYDSIIWIRVEPEQSYGSETADNLTVEHVMSQLSTFLCPDLAANTPSSERNLAIRQALKANPCLVVIDNLEIEWDTGYLFRYVSDLANPSKFLLTSRTRPPGSASVHTLALTDLSLAAATQLICHHAHDIGLADLAQVTEAEAQPIYHVTGGNPLAIKLVVSLAAVLPLSQILQDLEKGQVQKIEQMYRHIYWQAWQSLAEEARTLLEMMPMAGANGMREAQMEAISGLSKNGLFQAITELASRSLLEIRGTTQDRRYGIHRLTESFLKIDIIGLSGNGI